MVLGFLGAMSFVFKKKKEKEKKKDNGWGGRTTL
jgi:hypothetical protein